jgi:flagellar motor switch protein FliN/FliY
MADNEIEQGLEGVAAAASEVADAASAAANATGSAPVQTAGSKKHNPRTLDFLMDVSLQVSVEVGRARMTINDLLQMGAGSVVELEKLAGEPLDIFINGKPVARGEAVIVNEKFGVRLTDIISPEERVEGIA